MATIINYDKPTRAAKEQDAFQKLQSTLGRTPTQQEVYEQAYGSRFPVFNTDFEYNRIKEQIPETYKQYLEAPDKFMQDLVRPQRETAYAKKVNKALEGVGFMQKMALNNSILGDRSRAINDTVANRTNALGQFMNLQNMQLEQAKEPYAYAIDQANAGDAAYAAQLAHQQELQDYLWKKQVDQQFKGGSGGSGYAGTYTSAGITGLAQAILDGTMDPGSLSYDLQEPVFAEVSRLMSLYNTSPTDAAAEATTQPLTTGFFPDSTPISAQQYGQGLRDVVTGSAKGLGQGLSGFGSGIANLVKGLFGR